MQDVTKSKKNYIQHHEKPIIVEPTPLKEKNKYPSPTRFIKVKSPLSKYQI